jgi:hypothetical protein
MDSQGQGATLISLDHAGGSHGPAHLSVRFLSAREFVKQYAENLRGDGLFVRNAEVLRPLEDVSIDLYLPGFKVFRLKARVTHVVTEENAESYKSPVGAGLQLIEPSPQFKSALEVYLERLQHRSEKLVLVAGCDCTALLESAGYWTKSVTPDSLAEELRARPDELRALVIPAELYGLVESLVEDTPIENALVIHSKTNSNRLLTDLDAHLPASSC